MASGAEEAAKAARAKKKPSLNRPSIIGGVLSAVFSKETGMAKYSKLIASIFGSILGVVVSVIFGFAISKGFGTCVIEDPQIGEVCKVAGYTQAQVTAWLMGIFMTYLGAQSVFSFPPNTRVVAVPPPRALSSASKKK